jgi:hypothetical protein
MNEQLLSKPVLWGDLISVVIVLLTIGLGLYLFCRWVEWAEKRSRERAYSAALELRDKTKKEG